MYNLLFLCICLSIKTRMRFYACVNIIVDNKTAKQMNELC